MIHEVLQPADPPHGVRRSFFDTLKKESSAKAVLLSGALGAGLGGSATYAASRRKKGKPSLIERVEGEGRFRNLARKVSDQPGKAATVAALLSALMSGGKTHRVIAKRKIAFRVPKPRKGGALRKSVRNKVRRLIGGGPTIKVTTPKKPKTPKAPKPARVRAPRAKREVRGKYQRPTPITIKAPTHKRTA
tara:strand:- start:172 stop:741 length:570 start_codon:yes stop_codon:yes gene_type:complete